MNETARKESMRANHSVKAWAFVIGASFLILLAGCSSGAQPSGNISHSDIADGNIAELAVHLIDPAPQEFPLKDIEYSESLLEVVRNELAKEKTLRPVENGTHTLHVFIDQYFVKSSKGNNIFARKDDELGVTAVLVYPDGSKLSVTKLVKGGGGILQMTERARLRQLGIKLADSLSRALRDNQFTALKSDPVALNLENFALASMEFEVAQNPSLRAQQRSDGSRQPQYGSRTQDKRSQTLRTCTVEQVQKMISIGLSNEQIRDACD
jgi:hypothetical protein